MTTKHPVSLNSLPQTALITLWAKGTEYARADALLRDETAAKLMQRLDYDFSKFSKAEMSQAGCCARAALIDAHARRFLAAHPDGVVIQLGCGLDARYERLGRPPITAWYDLDLPEMMQIRSALLPETGNHYLAASLLDDTWLKTVRAHGKPVLVLVEGVLMYLPEKDVRRFFQMAADGLPAGEIVFDSLAPFLLRRAKKHDALRSMGDVPEFHWAPKDFAALQSWHPRLRVAETEGISRLCGHRYPWFVRLMLALPLLRGNMDQRVVRVVLD